MEKLLRYFSLFDWFLGVIFIILGIYLSNPWFALSGGIAFITAWYKPAERINEYVKSKLIKKQEQLNDSQYVLEEDAFYQSLVESEAPKQTVSPTISYSNRVKAYGDVRVSTRKYIAIAPEHFVI